MGQDVGTCLRWFGGGASWELGGLGLFSECFSSPGDALAVQVLHRLSAVLAALALQWLHRPCKVLPVL